MIVNLAQIIRERLDAIVMETLAYQAEQWQIPALETSRMNFQEVLFLTGFFAVIKISIHRPEAANA